ncbi:MAG: hypothetical protein IJB49_02700 [Clostridia bacterium]|nr:hypothetical protein [Clostridia bacterium]
MKKRSLLTEYSGVLLRAGVAVALFALMAAFILAFRSGLLPYASDGDAFDTIYAIEESKQP